MRFILTLFSLFIYALAPLPAQEQVTLLFAGDLMQHQSQLNAALRAGNGKYYDYTDCFLQVRKEVSCADLAIANLEVPLGGRRYAGYPMFCAPDSYLHAIKECGFDVLLTANNHCLDRGAYGLLRTRRAIDSVGLMHCGTYADTLTRTREYPLLICKNGFRIVLLNYTYGTNGLNTPSPLYVNMLEEEQMLQDIRRAEQLSPDVLIACLHWGEEYRRLPENSQRRLAEWLMAHGVDHVVGSHPHVLQPIEMHRHTEDGGKPHIVAYSLGNYLSGMYERTKDGGAMLKLTFEKEGAFTTLIDARYSLVWVARPERDGVPNFMLIPSCNSVDSLPLVAKQKFQEFMEDSRRLFMKNNIGVSEYQFEP